MASVRSKFRQCPHVVLRCNILTSEPCVLNDTRVLEHAFVLKRGGGPIRITRQAIPHDAPARVREGIQTLRNKEQDDGAAMVQLATFLGQLAEEYAAAVMLSGACYHEARQRTSYEQEAQHSCGLWRVIGEWRAFRRGVSVLGITGLGRPLFFVL